MTHRPLLPCSWLPPRAPQPRDSQGAEKGWGSSRLGPSCPPVWVRGPLHLGCASAGCWAAPPSSPWPTSSCGSCPPSPACEASGTRLSTACSRPWPRDDCGDGGNTDGGHCSRAHRLRRPQTPQVRGHCDPGASHCLPECSPSLLHCGCRGCSDLPRVHQFTVPRGEGAARPLCPSLRPRLEFPGWAEPHYPAPTLPEAGDLLPVHLCCCSGGAELPGPVLYTCLPATRPRPGPGANYPGLSRAEHPAVGVGSPALWEEDVSLWDLCDGALCDLAGCCAHSTCGICRGLCIWREHCCVLAATLVGWVWGPHVCPQWVSPPSCKPAVPGPLRPACAGDGGHQLHPQSPPERTSGSRNGGGPAGGWRGVRAHRPSASLVASLVLGTELRDESTLASVPREFTGCWWPRG
ncbi:sphingosine-1-phosphate transporter MFSD2B isoform X2 [Pan paniscus]|uniref:sphingosine-1-phosphate transporter MFSD2B isoform X2 n=1 Tax=Pan paniscus TaxID=9597 RepID=UPI0030079C2E